MKSLPPLRPGTCRARGAPRRALARRGVQEEEDREEEAGEVEEVEERRASARVGVNLPPWARGPPRRSSAPLGCNRLPPPSPLPEVGGEPEEVPGEPEERAEDLEDAVLAAAVRESRRDVPIALVDVAAGERA